MHVQARLVARGELQTDRSLEGHRHRAGCLVPNHIIDIGSRKYLVCRKPLFGFDIEIRELKCLAVDFRADATGIVYRDIDTRRFNIGLTNRRSRTGIRVDDGIGDRKQQLLLAPTVVILGCNGLG